VVRGEVRRVQRPERRRWVAACAVGVVLGVVATGCGVTVGSGGPTAAAKTGVIGSPTTSSSTSTTTTTTTAPAASAIKVVGDDGAPTNQTVVAAITDLQRWWTTEFPAVYDGEKYRPVSGGFHAIDENTDPTTVPCSPKDIQSVLQNAFYCPQDDAVVWDQAGLIPDLSKQYGPFTVGVVLAHEWGHAIQQRANFSAPTVIMELQADCFAGAWAGHVKTSKDSGFTITTEDLDRAMAGILSLRDAPGSSASDASAHGSGFDRVGAFQDGFEQGASRCAAYKVGDPEPFQFPFNDQTDAQSGGDMPLNDVDANNPGITTAAFQSLDKYWKQTFPKISGGTAWTPLKAAVPFSPDSPPTCNGSKVTGYGLFLCVPDRFIGFDNVDTIPQAYKDGGDFAVAALFATQYGLEVQQQLGKQSTNQVTTTLRGDCYAGAWAAALIPPNEFDQSDSGLVLSPGDLDEAVGVLLSFRSASDRSRQGPGFARVEAFRTGVLKGPNACSSVHA